MSTHPRLPVCIILIASLAAQSGCSSAQRRMTTSGPAIDRGRAMARLERIEPVPRFPPAPTDPPPPPSAAAQRYFQKAREHFDQQLWVEAISALERALQSDPRYVDARVLLARACVQNGNTGLAINRLEEAVRDRPRDPIIHQLLGEIAWQENRTADAISEFRLALLASEDQPKLPERVLARLSLAMALRKEGYLSAAVDQLESYLAAVHQPTEEMRKHRELSEIMVLYRGKAAGLIAEIQMELGQPGLAAEAYARASAESPEDKGLRARWARSLAAAGKTDAALDVAQKYLADFPEDAGGLALLRELCDGAGRKDRYDTELVRLARSTRKPAFRMQLIELLMERGRGEEAIEILKQAPAGEARDGKAGLLLGRLCLERGRMAEALAAFMDVLRDQPGACGGVAALIRGVGDEPGKEKLDEASRRLAAEQAQSAEAAFLRAAVLSALGRGHEAEEILRACLKGHDRFAPAWALLAERLVEKKKWEEAVEAIDAAVQAGLRDSAIYLLKGRCLAALDEREDAEAALMEAFELNRKSAEPLYLLAELAERREDAKRSEMLYRQIVEEVDPRHIPSREKLVRMNLTQRDMDQARAYFADFRRLGLEGPAEARCRALIELDESKTPRSAQRLEKYRARLQEILEKYPQDVATRIDIAVSLIVGTVADPPKALEQVTAALAVDPSDTRARELRAVIQARLLDFAGAAETYRGLLADRPRDSGYQRSLLDMAVYLGDDEEAIRRSRQLMAMEKRAPAREFYLSQLIVSLQRLERFDDSIKEARKWLEEAPKDGERRTLLLAALVGAKRHDEAVETARKWLAEDPTNEELRRSYVDQLRAAGRVIEAQQRVLAWLEHEPDDTMLNQKLVQLFWFAKEWDQAIETLQTGMETSSSPEMYQILLGQTYAFARRFDEAARYYRERARRDPSLGNYRAWINVLISAERYDEAERVIAPILQRQLAAQRAGAEHDEPAILEMRRRLATVYQLQGRDERAIEQFEELMKVIPQDPGLNNDFGYSLADRGERIEEAERMIRLAVGQMPRESAYLDSLGWVLYKRGRFDEAITWIERAMRLRESDDPVFHDHLGDALYRAGQVDRAKAEWEKAAKLLESAADDTGGLEYRRVREATARKLKQLAEGKPADTALLAGEGATSRPAGR